MGAVTDEDGGLPRAFVAELAAAGVRCEVDPAVLAGPARDWTGRWTSQPLGLVRPVREEQVAAVVRAANRHRVPLHVQGGNTGLVGGSVPPAPALIVSTTGLIDLGPVDPLERTVVAGAGVTCARLAEYARDAGLHFGVDLAARDSATVGGMVATNAGGLEVVAFGMMRSQVRGLRAVLADGRVLDTTGRPAKDNTGYHLTGLLVGSEGTLGVVTAVEVGLHPRPPASSVALLAAPDLHTAARAARAIQREGGQLLAAEVVDSAGVARAAADLGVADPLAQASVGRSDQWLVLVEVADGGAGLGLAPVADEVITFSGDASGRARLWALRERQTELYAGGAMGPPEKLDVSVRLHLLDELVRRIRAVVGEPGGVGFFGHVLDGNLHVQLIGQPAERVGEVLAAVAELGGSISAEHGIGRMKAEYLPLAHDADAISLMRDLKRTVDPRGLLNRGVLFVP